MPSTEYHFTTYWTVQASPEEIYNLLSDAEDLKRWWPSVYLDVKQIHPGNADGLGKEVQLYTKGWLPYTLLWSFRTTSVNFPTGFSLEAIGDFKGKGVWTFAPGKSQGTCDITYDWRIAAEKPLLRYLSFILKPIFSFNHHWAMRKGLESLRLEITRRHAIASGEKIKIGPPPQPTWPHRNRNNRVF